MTVRLDCGHTRPDDRVDNGAAYCGRCFKVAHVIGHIDAYRVRCLKCPLSRDFGTDVDSAYRFALRHQRIYGHAIRVGSEVLRASTQLPLFHV